MLKIDKRVALSLTVIVVGGIGIPSLQKTAGQPLPVYGHVGNFRLIDSRGQEFDSARLNNKIWVTAFFFTTCGDICPLLTRNLKALQETFRPYPEVEFVSISVNPEQDTPPALAAYAQKFGADIKRWHFLTGSREVITPIAVREFKVGSVSEPIFHSAAFVLVDRRGDIRGYYEGTHREGVQKLAEDIRRLYPRRP